MRRRHRTGSACASCAVFHAPGGCRGVPLLVEGDAAWRPRGTSIFPKKVLLRMSPSLTPCPKPLINAIAATAAALALTACGGGGGSGFAFPVSQAPAPAPASQAAAPAPAPAPAPVPTPVPPPAGSLIGNTTPVSNAGAAQSATAGATVKLDGSASTDADNDTLSYAWTLTSKPAGSASTFVGADTAKPTFIPDVAGSYVASLIVNDGKVNSQPATVTVTAADAVAFDSIPSPFPLHMPSDPFGTLPQRLSSLGERITRGPGPPGRSAASLSGWKAGLARPVTGATTAIQLRALRSPTPSLSAFTTTTATCLPPRRRPSPSRICPPPIRHARTKPCGGPRTAIATTGRLFRSRSIFMH